MKHGGAATRASRVLSCFAAFATTVTFAGLIAIVSAVEADLAGVKGDAPATILDAASAKPDTQADAPGMKADTLAGKAGVPASQPSGSVPSKPAGSARLGTM